MQRPLHNPPRPHTRRGKEDQMARYTATKHVFEDIHEELDILRRALQVTKREFAPIAALAREFLAPRDCEQHGQLCRHCLDACISDFVEAAAVLPVWEAAERGGVHNTVQPLKGLL